MAESKSRILKFDNTKAFLMLIVVFGHGLTPFLGSQGVNWATLWLYSFHMPLFVFLTGLFAKKAVSKEKLDFRKIVSFALLGMFIKVATHLTLVACGKNPKFNLLEENGVAWYIFVMAVHMIISHAVRKLTPWKVLLTSVVIALLAGYVDDIGNVFVLSRIITFFPAFYLGVIADREKLTNFVNKPLVRVASALFFVSFTVGIYFVIDKVYPLRYVLTGNNPYCEFGAQGKAFGALLRLGCYVLSLMMGLAVISLSPNRKIPFFTFCGSRTLSVYALHRPVQLVMETLFLTSAIGSMQPRYILALVMGISVLLTFLLSLRPFEYVLYPFTAWDKFFSSLIRWFRKPEFK